MDIQGAITSFGDLIGGSKNITQTVSTPTVSTASSGLSTGAIVGISVGALAIFGIIITVIMSQKSKTATA
jgi:hypothetical protein